MSDHHYCQEYEDRGKPCGLLADCPLCGYCWAHCDGHADPKECKHGVPFSSWCDVCRNKL